MSVLKLSPTNENEEQNLSAMSPAVSSSSPTDTSFEEAPSVEPLRLRDFAITRRIGQGTYGTVLLVKHNTTGRYGALKITRKYLENEGESSYMTPAEQQFDTALRFLTTLQEQHALRRVTGAPGMLEMLASFHDTNNFYVLSAYYPGGNLELRLLDLERFSVHDTRLYAAELILGLQTLRDLGVIHRDINPSNVLIDAEGHLALADFGLARTFDEYDGIADWGGDPFPLSLPDGLSLLKRRANMRCGSPEYISPEIIAGGCHSHPADMWSVGVIIFRMLVGRLPWDLADYDDEDELYSVVLELPAFIMEEEITEFALDDPEIDLIGCMLEKSQNSRPIPSEMKEHPFFESINWKKLAQRQIPAPWVPSAEHALFASGPPQIIAEGPPFECGEDPFPDFTFMSPKMVPGALLSPVAVCPDTPETHCSMDSTLCTPDTPPSLPDDQGVALVDISSAAAIFSECASVLEFSNIVSEVSELPTPVLSIDPCPLTAQCTKIIPEPPAAVSHLLALRGPESEPPLVFASPDQDLELGLGKDGDGDLEQPTKLSIFGRLKSWAVGLFDRVKKAWSIWGSTSSTF